MTLLLALLAVGLAVWALIVMARMRSRIANLEVALQVRAWRQWQERMKV